MAASVLAAILVYTAPVLGLEPGNISAKSAVLLDGDSGQVLWEKDADTPRLIASTTKIMTALLTVENAGLDEIVEIPPEATNIEGSSMYLQAGERLTVRDLLHGLMLSSGNDAAVALAIHVCGDVETFVDRMNRRAEEMGLDQIHFANPNGLDDEGNYASARSLGRLAAEAMQNERFREIVAEKYYQAGNRSLKNHNKLLWQYPGAVGVKTGFTKKAGRILVGSAEKNGRRLIAVTISAPSDWADQAALLDCGFSMYEETEVLLPGQNVGTLPVISGDRNEVPLLAAEGVTAFTLPGEAPELRLLTAPFVYAPVEAGTVLGTVQVYVAGKLVGQTAVYAGETVGAIPVTPGLWARFRENLAERSGP